MRHVDKLIVHCSDSDHLSHDNYETIKKWHVDERGFNDVGYHFMIFKNGAIKKCRPLYKPGAHCKGQNKNSIGVCVTGKNEFSKDQFISLKLLYDNLKWYFGDIKAYGHRDFSDKTCPNFEVSNVLQ